METPDYSIFPERPIVYATFWERFAAMVIDYIIVICVDIVINMFIEGSFFGRVFRNIFINWLYFALQESGPHMATLGKRSLKIKVTDLNGGRITFGIATGRYFGKIISQIILLLGYFMMLWDDKKQTLHDKMAGTLVVSESSSFLI